MTVTGRGSAMATVITPVPSACYLSLLPAAFLLGLGSFDGFAHVMAGSRAPVLRSWRASRAGFAGFRRAGRAGQRLADVPEPAADPGRGQPAGRAGPLPGQPDVGGEVAGQAELGVAGEEDPGPPVGGGRVAQFRPGPAESLLEEPDICSISKRRRNACQARSTSAAEVPAREDHSHSGSGLRSPGSRPAASRIRVPPRRAARRRGPPSRRGWPAAGAAGPRPSPGRCRTGSSR